MTNPTFEKNVGTSNIDQSKKDYTYYWQLWHHNWDDEDIKTIEELCPMADQKILEVGCGDARITFALAQRCRSIVGADLCEPLIASAEATLNTSAQNNIKFELMDAEQLSFDNESFDAVLFPWVLQMVKDPTQAVREAHRVLKPEGKIVVIGLLDADYDDIIAQFVPNTSNIDPDLLYEQPLTALFGAEICTNRTKRIFKYYFENFELAVEAFKYALDKWYGGITLDQDGETLLFEILKDYQNGERICLEFPAYVYSRTK